MAKIKSTLTGPAKGQSEAYKRIRHSESLLGTVASGATVIAQTNCVPLNSMVCKDSLTVQHDHYDWKTGTFGDKHGDVLTNAQRHAGRLKFHAETAGHQQRQKEIDRKSGCDVASVPALARQRGW